MELFKTVKQVLQDYDTTKGIVELYASVFGNIDSDEDIIDGGSYTKTIQERGPTGSKRIWHLINHNPDRMIVKPKLLEEDTKGVRAISQFPEKGNNFEADYLRALYEQGDMTEHSVWIQIIKSIQETIQGRNIRRIKEVAMLEYSSVTWGANELAQTVSYKSISEFDKLIKSRERLLRDGTMPDESFKLLMADIEIMKAQQDDISKKLALLTEPPQQQEKPDAANASTLEAIKRINHKLLKLNQSGRGIEKTTSGA